MSEIKCLDLPLYLKKNKGQISKAKIVCLVNRQIPIPSHLKTYDSSGNIPVLVDIIGVELLKGEMYYVKGKGVAILGPTSLAPTANGEKRLLLLESNIQSVAGQPNYVSLTNIFYNKNISGYFLYATKTLFRDTESINNVYPEFVKIAKKAQTLGVDKCFDGIEFPDNYVSASEGVVFDGIEEKDKFVFKSKEDWYKDKSLDLQSKQTIANQLVDFIKQEESLLKMNKQELVCRNDIKEMPENFTKLVDGIQKSKDSVENKLEELEQYRGTYSIDDAIYYAYKQLKTYWKRPKSKGVATGRAVFKEVLNRVYPDYKEKKKGFSPIDVALDDMLYPAMDIWYQGVYSGPANKLLSEIIEDREIIYIQIIDFFLELRGRLTEGYSYGKNLGLDMFSIIKTNPYYLTMIDNRFTIEHLDKLGMLYDLNMEDSELKSFRNAAYLHNLMLDSDNQAIKDDTIVLKSVINRVFENGYILSKKTYELLQKTGMVIDEPELNGIINYIESGVSPNQFELPTDKWKCVNNDGSSVKYVRAIEGEDKVKAIEDYINSGLGIELEFYGVSYLADYYYANKEKYIIERLYELSESGYKPDLSSEDIEKCIKAFEKQKSLELNIPDFALEERQKDAVRILSNPVMCLTGPAGSGKTTTAEAIVYGLQNLLDINEDDIMFCAPTGKAANRLKEIVKKPTRTIHSLFLVGGDNHALLEEKEPKKKDDLGVLIVDESSMIKVDLMYNMITKISNGTRIYFLGDREQLPPIGSGKPFANLLTFLPTVVLNVTKRASDSSGITRNAKKIIYESESGNYSDLEQTDDFRIIPESIEKVVNTVKGICKYHLGKTSVKEYKKAVQNLGTDLSPDDIQVITPINKYNWGTKNLNKELQDIFNPQQGLALKFMKDYTTEKDNEGNTVKVPFYIEYRKGDRVIHLENQNKAKRFIKDGNFTFRKLDSEGVMNGDVGKVEGFYLANQMMFADDEDNELAEEFQGLPSTMFVAVEYTDMDEQGIPLNYIILYRTEKLDDRPDKNNIIEVSSTDLRRLDLAYALTVHKLQGSQAKLIICVFFKVYREGFISRNMIYTAITRAKGAVYTIGDVIGPHSAIKQGRAIEQVGKRLTISDKLYE